VAYTIAALIAGTETAAVLGEALGAASVALEQGLQLVPLTRPRAGEDSGPAAPSSFGDTLWWLTADAEEAAARAARQGPVAYAEAEYFGGVGEQRAVVWKDGQVTLLESELPGAINTALKTLGAQRAPSSMTGSLQDEFDSVGLGRHRSTQEWAATTSRQE
jgi:hypothetical protein